MAHGDVTHLEIPVTDLERAKDFYADLFGWEITAPPGFEEYPMWRAPNGISGGALTPREEGFTQPRSIVEVDSIDDTLAKAVAAAARSSRSAARSATRAGGRCSATPTAT